MNALKQMQGSVNDINFTSGDKEEKRNAKVI